MNSLKKAALWMWMLTKRLYKKPTFLAILVLIPLLTMGRVRLSKAKAVWRLSLCTESRIR